MISSSILFFLIPFLIAMFLGMNMGGSGIAPSFSVAYGSNVINKSVIAGLFGLMVFAGALIAGKQTISTIGKGILSPELMTPMIVSIILMAIAITLLISNLMGIPQSTSQATVFAVVAPAIYFDKLNTHMLFVDIIPTWFILPILSFIICFGIAKILYRKKIGVSVRGIGNIKNNKIENYKFIGIDLVSNASNKLMKFLIIGTSLYVAFSIGSNNVANAAGPISSMMINSLNLGKESNILIILIATLIVAPMFGIGGSLLGNKTLENTGKQIMNINQFEAVIISFISATLLLLASITKGIPTSLVQLNVGAILGVGVAKNGFHYMFNKQKIKQFFTLWFIAPIFSLLFTYFLIFLADKCNLL